MPRAAATDVPRIRRLHDAVDPCGSFVLSAAIPCARHDVVTRQADAPPLLLQDVHDGRAVLARAMDDVQQEPLHLGDGRGLVVDIIAPLSDGLEDGQADPRDLETQTREALGARRALVAAEADAEEAPVVAESLDTVAEQELQSVRYQEQLAPQSETSEKDVLNINGSAPPFCELINEPGAVDERCRDALHGDVVLRRDVHHPDLC